MSNFDKIFIRRNRSLIRTAPGDKKTTESLTDFYSPGCLIFAFPTHPPRQLWVWLWSQLLVLVWRVVEFVRRGWERGGGVQLEGVLSLPQTFFLYRLYIFHLQVVKFDVRFFLLCGDVTVVNKDLCWLVRTVFWASKAFRRLLRVTPLTDYEISPCEQE